MPTRHAALASLAAPPLVGRSAELTVLGGLLDAAEAGRGGAVFVSGEGGVGKTRLVSVLAERAAERGLTVALGRAYPVETGVPYAVFSDALLPLLRRMDPATLSVLTRGGIAELTLIFPALATAGELRSSAGRGDPSEVKARLLWNFTQFLSRYTAKHPLLLVLENLQWADASSLELLHFIVRQLGSERIAVVGTYNEAEREQNPALRTTEQSLQTLGALRCLRLAPLSQAETGELVQRVFGVDAAVARGFNELLYGWTRGNPFFVEETLKSLVESERLRERDGTWIGWDVAGFELPRSIRDAVVARLDRLGVAARATAELVAVIGTRASFDALASISALGRSELLTALDELRSARVLDETADGDVVRYDFAHPILQQTLYAELGLARARLVHAMVAEALERFYGERALQHADELAFHFLRASVRGFAPKTARYLAAAGRTALAAYASREAADYLSAALEQIDQDPAALADLDVSELVEDLARARQRLGDYAAATALWERARKAALAAGRLDRVAATERRMGLGCYWSGRYAEALAHYGAGLEAAQSAGDVRMTARLRLVRGACLLELGRRSEAQEEVQQALAAAEQLGDVTLLARAHRALLLLYAWTGPADLAREHGARAIELARASGQQLVACTSHWALAMLGGLTGNAAEAAEHLAESERLADELRSPVLRVWTAEVAIEYASGMGDWDAAVALAERTITLARSLGQRTLLPRLLVWSGLVYFGRGEVERGKAYVEEAWALSGAEHRTAARPIDVHTVVPAHTGRAAYYLATGQYAEAIRIGDQGLHIVEQTGYVVWAIHRLLPIMVEASLWASDLERAKQLGDRLRHDSERLGHKLGLAWSDASDALVELLRGDKARAVGLLRDAVDRLEAIPFVADAARLRRQLARALAETGDREGAMRELRHVHDVFARLGATRELDATREQLRALGARPPARAQAPGPAGLTGRELEIVRLVAARKSNKEIGTALGISARTVSTHLSNIFGKLQVSSRGELTDLARRAALIER